MKLFTKGGKIMYGYVYITYNKINGKIYIGQRKGQYDETYLGSGKYLKNAIRKYGKENFENYIIEWCETYQDLNEREIYWIAKYNCTSKNNFGYNIAAGGTKNLFEYMSQEDRKEINAFLNYKEDSAGSIMTTEYVEIKEHITCKEALKRIKTVGKEAETIYTTFVVDSSRKLVGALYLDDLIFADDKTLVDDIMNDDYISVSVDVDQENVALLMKKYDITTIPVVNKDDRLLGIITIDDIMDVIEQEQTEDLQKMAATTPIEGDYSKTSVFKLAWARVPWLLFLMLSATLTGIILNIFETALQVLPVLTLFIPMLMDTGGNAGGQTTTIVTRSLALGQIKVRDFLKVVFKEFRIGLIVGLCVAIVNFGWIFIELHFGIFQFDPASNANNPDWLIALLVALTSYCVIVLSKTIGSCLPLFAKLIHLDPAIMAGPLVTTIVDACSLAVYLLLSSLILNGVSL